MLGTASAYGLEFLYPAADTIIGPALRDHGEFARVIVDFLVDAADTPSGTLIDVGGNIGAISLPFAKARPNWSVIAVEAHHGLSELLSDNASGNGLDNVRVVSAAAGAERRVSRFPAPLLSETINFGNLSLRHIGGRVADVEVIPLDQIAPPDTRLVKIDVEGFELDVLRGAGRLLDARVTWLIEASVQHEQANKDIVELLRSYGYAVFWFYAPFVTPICRGGPSSTPAKGDANMVAIPTDRPNNWGLKAVSAAGERRPDGLDAYPYLARYGYGPATAR